MRKQSFTLIELLIVLVIIGVLVTLAVPQYQLFAIRARGAEAMNMVRSISDSVWRYYIETGRFPPIEPGAAIPSALDLNIQPGQSKYFQYTYQNFIRGNPPYAPNRAFIIIRAWDDAVAVNGPLGALGTYIIYYLYDTPSMPGYGPGQMMDEHWYLYYEHGIRSDEDPASKFRPVWHWPGGS